MQKTTAIRLSELKLLISALLPIKVFNMGFMISKIKKYSRFVANYTRPSSSRLAYIGGVYGSQNLGDEALRQAVEKLFSCCTVLEFPRKRHLARLAKVFLPVRNAVLAGGTLINQNEIWLDLVADYMLRIQNFIVFGTGVGHPSFWNDKRREWRELLKQCTFVGVRGPLSAQLLADVHVDRVEVVGDPALVFAFDKWDQSDSYTPDSIGINIGWDRAKQWGTQEHILSEATRLAALAKSARWRVRWFVVCSADLEITSKVATDSGTTSDICHVYNDPAEYMNLVKSCSVFVGTRLHSVVLATCAYIPSLMLAYRPKCKDYMLSIGQGDYVICTDKFHAEEVWQKAFHMNSERNRFSQELYLSMKPLRDYQVGKAQKLQEGMLD